MQAAEAEAELVGSQLETVVTSKSELEKVLQESFQGLKDCVFEESAVEAAVQTVMAAVEKLGLEGSLVATLPAVLARRERGAFDFVVIQGAEQGICDKIAALGAEAEPLAASRSAKVAAVEAAKLSVEEAAAHETEAAGKLQEANATSAEAVAATEEIRVELAKREADVVQVAAVRDAKQQELEQFCSYNVSIFHMLRDRTVSKEPDEKPEESKEEIVQECAEDGNESMLDTSADNAAEKAADKVADKVGTVLAEEQRATLVAVAGA